MCWITCRRGCGGELRHGCQRRANSLRREISARYDRYSSVEHADFLKQSIQKREGSMGCSKACISKWILSLAIVGGCGRGSWPRKFVRVQWIPAARRRNLCCRTPSLCFRPPMRITRGTGLGREKKLSKRARQTGIRSSAIGHGREAQGTSDAIMREAGLRSAGGANGAG